MNSIISLDNISKKYRIGTNDSYISLRDSIAHALNPRKKKVARNDFWALRDISFEVGRGESLGIIGRNGAGKSTLLKILSQITPPTTGKVTMRGRVASLLEVGTGFNPELTGRENVYLNGAILGMSRPEIKKKFDEIVDFSGVEKFLDTPVKRYSSGMYVRLAFSVAAHLEPEILIVDEVLAVGDTEFQKKCIGKMDDVAKKDGRTILFVSHNLVSVQSLCKKSILLDNGRIKKIGLTEKVIDEYLNGKSNSPAKTDLHNRSSKGEVRFTDIEIANASGSEVIRSDDSLRFTVKYNSDFEKSIQDARVIISVVSDNSQQIVLRLDSDVTSNTLGQKLAPQGELVCETGAINLVQGLYWVNLDLVIQGVNRDHLERTSSFAVKTDIARYGYKTEPDANASDYLIKYTFGQKR